MNTTRNRNRQAKAAGGYITLPPITKNKVAEVYYRRAMTDEIHRMLDAMFGAIKRAYTTIPMQNTTGANGRRLSHLRRELVRLQSLYGKRFSKNAQKIIDEYIKRANKTAQASILKQLRTVYGDGFTVQFNRTYGEALSIIAQRNALLISTTSAQLVSNVTNITFDGVTTGQSWRRVEQDLRKQKHIAADRIKRIARDQTAKLNESLNEMAMRDAGVEYFEWMTANDERVSTGFGGHKHLDGKIYKWGDNAHYPIIDTYGNRGVPGQRVNCRCTAVPVILQRDYTAHRTSDGGWVITKGRL